MFLVWAIIQIGGETMGMIVGCILTIMVLLIGIYLLYKGLKLEATSMFILVLIVIISTIGNDSMVLLPILFFILTILWYKVILKTGDIIAINRIKKKFIMCDIILAIAQVVMIYALIFK